MSDYSHLRSNLAVGSSRWAVRRAQWRALGISDEDLSKPKIGIVNTSSDLAICFSHLDGIVGPLKQAIRSAGGLPFEVRTAAPSDFITSAGKDGRYILPSRDLIVNDIEVAVEGAQLDGMVCLASCDKTVPGQLMAAARLNIPSIIVACGYQPSGTYRGEHMDIEEVFLQAGHLNSGRITLAELTEMTETAILGPGVCAGIGTANSMHIVCEALGMALPGTTPVLANSDSMWSAIDRAGSRIIEMVSEGLRPRDILTLGAFRNAAIAILALSGSINTIKHLQAIAIEAQLDVDILGLFESLADTVPLIAAIRPNGNDNIEDLEAAGGAQAVMKQLSSLLDLDAINVEGKTVGEVISSAEVVNPEVIRSMLEPFAMRPSIVVLRGSLAPDGAVLKLPVLEDRPTYFSGPARIYHSRDSAVAAIERGEVKRGEVLVLNGIGLRGGPGMGMASAVVFALDGAGLGEDVALITDGQLSGLVNRGLVVGEIAPEAAAGGPLGLVQNGDVVTIDLNNRRVDLDVAPEILRSRVYAQDGPIQSSERGWLKVYEQLVTPLSEGATLGGTTKNSAPRN